MNEITREVSESISHIVRELNYESGSAIPILQRVQERLGHVSPGMIQQISDLTGIPASELYGIVTFYSQFHLEPRGENIVRVCHGTACHLAGAERVTHAVEMATGAKDGGTSEDGRYTVERVACLGCCSLAPVVMINEEAHAKVDPDKVKSMFRQFEKKIHEAENTDEKPSEGKDHA